MKTKDEVKKSESQELRTRLADGLSDILYLPFVFIDIPGSFVQNRARRGDGLRRRRPRGDPPSETSRVTRIYNNRGNEAKKSLNTKELTF
jgi:hypothetical protein